MSDQAVVMLVEDDENDVKLVRRAFLKVNVFNPLHIVRTGEEAVEYLRGTGRYRNREEYPLPELMLLDLHLPGMGGLRVLQWIRRQPELKALRIVVLTSCQTQAGATEAYRNGANSFLVKPVDFEDLVAVTKAINVYWLWTSKTPEIMRPTGSADN